MAIKYKWLAARLRESCHTNMQKGITKLPTENELCRRYHVSRQTVRQALTLLQQEGLIEKRQGSGTYITGLLSDSSLNQIAILLSDTQEYIYPGVLADLRDTLSSDGFKEDIYETNNSLAKEREILSLLLSHPPRGIIAEGCKSALPNPNLDLYAELIQKGTAVLFLYTCYIGLENCIFIKDDNYAGSALLVRHLVSQGHRHVGCIFKSDDIQGIERYQGYIETLRDCGLSFKDEMICWYDETDLEMLRTRQDTAFLRRMVADRLSACSAVICYNDEIAYWLIKELLLAGYQLPGQMSVAAFDNTYLSEQGILTVTTLSHRPHEIGRRAASMMIDKLKGLPVHSLEVPWSLSIKDSVNKILL